MIGTSMIILNTFIIVVLTHTMFAFNRFGAVRWFSEHIGAKRQEYAQDLMRALDTDLEVDPLDLYWTPHTHLLLSLTSYCQPVLVLGLGTLCSALSPSLVWLWALSVSLIFVCLWFFKMFVQQARGMASRKDRRTGKELLVVAIDESLAVVVLTATLMLGYTSSASVFERMRMLVQSNPYLSAVLQACPNLLWKTICAIVVFFGLWVTYVINRFGGRVSRLFTSPHFELAADAGTVLLLRSFKDDDINVHTLILDDDSLGLLHYALWPRSSFEESIQVCMKNSGFSLIAVGRPGERLPRAGAVRAYYDINDWQEGVRLTALRSRGILFTLGATTSLGWEIEHIKAWGLLPKCLFLIPPISEDISTRLQTAFRILGISDTEYNKATEIVSTDYMVAFRINSNGTVHWMLSVSRDWKAYLLAIIGFEQWSQWGSGFDSDVTAGRAEYEDPSFDEFLTKFENVGKNRPMLASGAVKKRFICQKRPSSRKRSGTTNTPSNYSRAA